MEIYGRASKPAIIPIITFDPGQSPSHDSRPSSCKPNPDFCLNWTILQRRLLSLSGIATKNTGGRIYFQGREESEYCPVLDSNRFHLLLLLALIYFYFVLQVPPSVELSEIHRMVPCSLANPLCGFERSRDRADGGTDRCRRSDGGQW